MTAASPHEIPLDDVFPRDDEHRYRIYFREGDEHRYRIYFREGDELGVPYAACATPEALGLTLATIHEDQKTIGKRLSDLGQIGVLDTLPEKILYDSDGHRLGEWILLPFASSA